MSKHYTASQMRNLASTISKIESSYISFNKKDREDLVAVLHQASESESQLIELKKKLDKIVKYARNEMWVFLGNRSICALCRNRFLKRFLDIVEEGSGR